MEYLGPYKSVNKLSPKVSICVPTYQHASYVRQCLENILKQRTNFPFEIIIGEDESSDGTRDICIEYAEKYPHKIRLFLRNRRDMIKIYGRPTGRYNFIENIKAARGKYIAICEGDDFWTDTMKLQKQHDFMETYPDYSACLHDADIYSERTNRIIGSYSSTKPFNRMWKEKNYLELSDILQYWHAGPTASFFFRNIITTFPSWMYKIYGGDTGLMILLAQKGRIGLEKSKMSVYRFENSQSLTGQDRISATTVALHKIRESFYLMGHLGFRANIFLWKRIGWQFLVAIRNILR
ncbi:glycosyltransferase family 2 protein [Gracilibacillus dipsosauri]|uniref:glycosyltransferase family 2 protein n=1 Tax=Gracilibacillus dipsosauri TaxID=178340 RepID=UPI0024098839